jgi:hypothetical protein
MILFISDFPTPQNEREGMMQRVRFIDSMFGNHEKYYLEFSNSPQFSRYQISSNTCVYKANTFFHRNLILKIATKASLIYFHSIYNSNKALFLYNLFGEKIITDLHGVVPEEIKMLKHMRLKHFENVEMVAVSKSRYLISVTESMVQHFQNKYSRIPISKKSLVIPLLSSDKIESQKNFITKDKRLKIVYTGGLQIWQNIPFMLKTISEKQFYLLFDFTFYVSNKIQFQKLLKKYNLVGLVDFDTLSHLEVLEKYENFDFGLIIRDENIVNKVSLPTKLIEYISYGLIPIIKNPDIGDFMKLNYSFIEFENLKNEIQEPLELKKMRDRNFEVMDQIYANFSENSGKLLEICEKP